MLLSDIFSKAQFSNVMVAIVSHEVAGVLAKTFGKVDPFDTAKVVLGITGAIVLFTWKENYGDSAQLVSSGLKSAWSVILADENIFFLGIIQSYFESAMYRMVFSWTSALRAASDAMKLGENPHCMILSSFMVCIMICSALLVFLKKAQPMELLTRNLYLLGAATPLSGNVWHVYAALLAFETICGVYFPAVGTMRAKYVPEVTRAAIMNYVRATLTVTVCAVLHRNMDNSCSVCVQS